MTENMPLVTRDPALAAQLRAQIDELGSREMAEFARSLGLAPPSDRDALVVLHFPADTDVLTDDGQIVWDLRPDTEAA